MSNALATKDDDALLRVMEASLYPGASKDSVQMALSYCTAAGLDPLQKPVHIVPMWDNKQKRMRDIIMPGIGLYRVQAARNGCAGISEPEFGPDITEVIGTTEITYPQWCRVTVKRRLETGEVVEFTANERWRENYAEKGGRERDPSPNAMWTKRPYAQLAKCAEAQALRKAFPEVGSQPTADEMEGKPLHDEHVERHMGTAEVVQPAEKPTWPDDRWQETLPRMVAGIKAGKTIEDALAWLRAKGNVTPEQEQQLRNAVAPQNDAETGEIQMTAEHVIQRMRKADTLDKLHDAASLIDAAPETDRERLNQTYDERVDEFNQGEQQ